MAKNYEKFRKRGKQMVDFICNYAKNIDQRPVAPTIDPGYLVPLLAGNKSLQILRICRKFKFHLVLTYYQTKCRKRQKPTGKY